MSKMDVCSTTPCPNDSPGKPVSSDDSNHTPPPCGPDLNASDKLSSDSDLSDDDVNSPIRPHIRDALVRRSARIPKSVDRYRPDCGISSPFSGKGSVFGHGFSARLDVGGCNGPSDVKRLLRECAKMDAREAEVKKLRQDIVKGKRVLDESEKQFKAIADGEEEVSRKEAAAREKYSAPIRVFVNPVCKVKIRDKLISHDQHPKSSFTLRDYENEALLSCPVYDMLIQAENTKQDTNMGLSLVGPYIRKLCEKDFIYLPPCTVKTLFYLCIYDESEVNGSSRNRDDLFGALLDVVSRSKKDGTLYRELPSLSDVFQSYGAHFNWNNPLHDTKTEAQNNGESELVLQHNATSLDELASKGRAKRSYDEQSQLDIATRNMRRDLRFVTAQLGNSWSLSSAIGFVDKMERNMNDYIVQTVELCVRVLLSSFGSRLKREIGLVVKAAITRISQRDWPVVRFKIAQSIVQLSSRLTLHVELVTYLFPTSCRRSLQCSLDIAFASLYQWCQGPGNNPFPKDITNFCVSEAAREFGIDCMSFCIGDVLSLVECIPEMTKDTDVVWACGLSRILKQILTVPNVLQRRKPMEIGRLNQFIQKLRQCSHRMVFGVAVQDMRMALDALLRGVHFMCSLNRETKAELEPNVKNNLQQTRLK